MRRSANTLAFCGVGSVGAQSHTSCVSSTVAANARTGPEPCLPVVTGEPEMQLAPQAIGLAKDGARAVSRRARAGRVGIMRGSWAHRVTHRTFQVLSLGSQGLTCLV